MLKTCYGPFSNHSSLRPLPEDVMPLPLESAKASPLALEQSLAQTQGGAKVYDAYGLTVEPQPKPQPKPQMKQPQKWFSRAEPEKAVEQAQDDESAGRISALQQTIEAYQADIEELKAQLGAAQQQNRLQQEQLAYLQAQYSATNSRCIFLQGQAQQYKTNQIQLNMKLSRLYAENDSLRAAQSLGPASAEFAPPLSPPESDFIFLSAKTRSPALQAIPPVKSEDAAVQELKRYLTAKSDEINAERHRNLCLQAQLEQLRASASPGQARAQSQTGSAARFTTVAGM